MNAHVGAEHRLQNMYSKSAQLLQTYAARHAARLRPKTEAVGLPGGLRED